jgi:hypothetical protein
MKTPFRRNLLFIGLLALFAACGEEAEAPLHVKTYAGSGVSWETGSVPLDGILTEATFNSPTQIAVFQHEFPYKTDLYVVDANYYIRKIENTGSVTARERQPVYFSELSLSTAYKIFDVGVYTTVDGESLERTVETIETLAEFETNINHSAVTSSNDVEPPWSSYDGMDIKNHLRSITWNKSGEIFTGTNRGVLLIHNPIFDTLAGGEYGYADGAGKLAQFRTLYDIVTDEVGNIYVADGDNHCIRKVTREGEVTTFAGTNQAGFVDGLAANARFNNPRGIAIDKNGILYVGDTGNHSIRKIDSDGGVSTLAGRAQGFQDGTVDNAMFDSPEGIAIDHLGHIYVADRGNNRIRIITTSK